MKFKIDENLPADCADALRSFGHDAVTVLDEGIVGTSDPELLHLCRLEERVLMTLDLDFADIRDYPPEDSPGIIIFRIYPQDKHHILKCLNRLIPVLEDESVRQTLWIVEEERVRIRNP